MQQKLRFWLGQSPLSDRYDDARKKRLNGTCEWILHKPQFLAWRAPEFPTSTKLLWINGNAGFGKTVLCAHIIDSLQDLDGPVAHFFFTSDDSTSRGDPFVALRSWISQVTSRHGSAFDSVYQRADDDPNSTATRATILGAFTDLVRAVPGCTFVADGLDECAFLTRGSSSVARFIQDVAHAVADTDTRILLVSRSEPDIRHALVESCLSFDEYTISAYDVRHDTDACAKQIVNSKLDNKSNGVRLDLSNAMSERCEGQFLWLDMQQECLRKGMNTKQLQKAIRDSPADLGLIYDNAWQRIIQLNEEDKNQAFALLRWAAFALRPLTVSEITQAVLMEKSNDVSIDDLPDAVDDDYIDTEIAGLCGSLVDCQGRAGRLPSGPADCLLATFHRQAIPGLQPPNNKLAAPD